jgi:hypothetical protein
MVIKERDIACGVILHENNKSIPQKIRKQVREYYLSREHKIDFIEFTEDSCIQKALQMNVSYLIMIWEGNVVNNPFFYKSCVKFIKDIENSNPENWLIAGHIIDQYKQKILQKSNSALAYKNSFYLYPINAILNLKTYKALGKPNWGQVDNKQPVTEGIADLECVHDNYTPVKLHPGIITVPTQTNKGWNIINASLANKMTVYNIPKYIRDNKAYLYPTHATKYCAFWDHVSKKTYSFDKNKFHAMYKEGGNDNNYDLAFEFLTPSKNFNVNENGFYLRTMEEYFPRFYNQDDEKFKAEVLLSPCSGFKDFIKTSQENTFHKIIHFDISELCLDIKKRITEDWDGTRSGFTKLLIDIENFYQTKNIMKCFNTTHVKKYDDAYQEILSFFANEDDLLNKWKAYQKLSHSWHILDVLDTDALISICKQQSLVKIYLTLGNITEWKYPIVVTKKHENFVPEKLASLAARLQDNGIHGLLDYKDFRINLGKQILQNFQDVVECMKK